jgi:molybdopterin synthase catalytic subunit
MVRIASGPFDAAAMLAVFMQRNRESGGVVSFTGVVRGDDGVTALELEHYRGFTEREIERRRAEVLSESGATDAMIVHRVGRIPPGEAVVFVAAASAHRRQAFQAADSLMDWLKTSAPFWKREHTPSGARWIEPRAEDYKDAARWISGDAS